MIYTDDMILITVLMKAILGWYSGKLYPLVTKFYVLNMIYQLLVLMIVAYLSFSVLVIHFNKV